MAKKRKPRARIRVCFCDEDVRKDVRDICRRLGRVKTDSDALLLKLKRRVDEDKARSYLRGHRPKIVSVEIVRKKLGKKKKAPR